MKPPSTKSIAVFGGSFDPIHLGHLHLAELVREEFCLSEIVFMPSARPPHKETAASEDAEHRFEMVKLAIDSNPNFSISRLEYDRDGYSYTAETLQLLREELESDALIYFIVGADSLVNMHKWKEPERIFALCEIIAIDRQGIDDEEIITALKSLSNDYNAKIHLLKKLTYPVSSTEIRARIATGASIKYLVPDEVIDYIGAHNLYRGELNLDGIKAYLKTKISPKRYAHSERTAAFAAHLAKVHGEDVDKAYLAGLLHDMAKELTPPEAQKYSCNLNEFDLSLPYVNHSFLGAEMAREVLKTTDSDILNAIRYHTTARLSMSPLEQIIFIADKIEEGRKYPECEYLKALAESDLDKAMIETLQITTSIARRKGQAVHPLSAEVLKNS